MLRQNDDYKYLISRDSDLSEDFGSKSQTFDLSHFPSFMNYDNTSQR